MKTVLLLSSFAAAALLLVVAHPTRAHAAVTPVSGEDTAETLYSHGIEPHRPAGADAATPVAYVEPAQAE